MENKTDQKIPIWENKDVAEYYENVPVELLKEYAIKGGIDSGCDLKLSYKWLKDSTPVLELGAGYGRVIEALLANGYDGEIYAIERSNNLFQHLKEKFKNFKNVHLIQSDLLQFNPSKKFQSIVWMWSNISEFPREQQLSVLKHITQWLSVDGSLVIETISHELTPKNASFCKDQYYVVSTEYGTAYGYVPSVKEVLEYGRLLGFKILEPLPYKTETGRDRILYLFSNKNT